ncbi:hypothetical protein K491DRAFT_704461 [Lophiostoma macrostomum CBS 122681]|uniref:Tat pathway signal sequence n=1 Tax=Lophiostoma macrostomum CBS 122681 TaxID=1314788 RepID=A0A6A6T7T5_9PLEO|nr:hypothetical protein K491DRAFT_704461 [Lophiostoma macrostomum CBS 122681]
MLSQLFERSPDQGQEEADTESLLPPSIDPLHLQSVCDDRRKRDIRVALWTMLGCSIVYVVLGICAESLMSREPQTGDADAFCIEHISQYSPVVKEMKPGWHTHRFNGSFFHESIYRKPPSDEVDAAWTALGADRTGLRSDQVKVSDYYGGGFPANVEGLHHLHCLNLLRKALCDYVVRYHVTHCLDILRQQLMCVTDIGVLGQVWYQLEGEEKPTPFVDFNTKHRCRDYEAIRVWAETHQLPPESEVDMRRFYEMPKPGDKVYPEIP